MHASGGRVYGPSHRHATPECEFLDTHADDHSNSVKRATREAMPNGVKICIMFAMHFASNASCLTPSPGVHNVHPIGRLSSEETVLQLAHKLGIGHASILLRMSRTLKLHAGGKTIVLRVPNYDRSPLLGRIAKHGLGFESSYGLKALPQLQGVALDIGAHYGTTGIALATMHERLRVFAFEPSPITFLFLCLNVLVNGLQGRVIPHNLAFASSAESIMLDYAPDDSTSTRLQAYGHSLPRRMKRVLYNVPTATFASFLDGCGIYRGGQGHVAFVKLDCEGCNTTPSPAVLHAHSRMVSL